MTTIAHSIQEFFAHPKEKYNDVIGYVAGKTLLGKTCTSINQLQLKEQDSTLAKVGKVALAALLFITLAATVAAPAAGAVLLAQATLISPIFLVPLIASVALTIFSAVTLSSLFGSPQEPPTPPAPDAADAVAPNNDDPNAALSVAADTATDAAATTDSREAQTSTVAGATEDAPTGTENVAV